MAGTRGCKCCVGSVSLNGQELQTSDGAAVSDESLLTIQANGAAEVMLFDLN